MAEREQIALIMAGGSGTRFWPLSTKNRPKQYLELISHKSLIQQTVERLEPLFPPRRIFVCSTEDQKKILRDQLPRLSHFIFEPFGRNTAPCLLLSTLELLRLGFDHDCIMVVLPSDHFIAREELFRANLKLAMEFARRESAIVTLGITPTFPHTGYGYMEAGEPSTLVPTVRTVTRFTEKPDLKTATDWIRRKNFFWNSGIFVWSLRTICQAFQTHMPVEWQKLNVAQHKKRIHETYETLPSVPIDVAVLEKAQNLFMLPTDMGWSDVGSWNALYDLSRGQDSMAIVSGTAKAWQSERCLVHVPAKRRVALVGVQDLIVVEQGETLLVAHRDADQTIRDVAKEWDK